MTGRVLEVASGTGEHAAFFAAALPDLVWQPTDPDAGARESVSAWREQVRCANLLPPLLLDAADVDWSHSVGRFEAVLCSNMVHISPWAATQGLMAGAAAVLAPDGALVLYGPFRREGHAVEPGNMAFDEELRRRNAEWGLRRVEDVRACAAGHGIAFDRLVEMPANNLVLVFRKR